MRSPRHRDRLVAVVVALVLVLGVGAALAATGDDGEATPEAAARRLVDAVAAGDALGVLESLPPGERRPLLEPLPDLLTELQRLGLVSDADLHRVPGEHVEVTDLQVRTTGLSDGVAAVDLVGGRVTGSVDPGGLPVTQRLRDLLGLDVDVHLDGPAQGGRDLGAEPLRLMAIHEGGGWHVSLAYTLAEAARQAAGAPLPAFGTGPDAIGADTPEAAVRDLVKAYADADPERAVTLTSPDEARALYDYAPLFLRPVQRAGRRADDEGAYDAQVNRVDLATSGTGGTRQVRIRHLDVDLRDEVHKTHAVFDGRCLVVDHRFGDQDPPFDSYRSCDGDPAAGDAALRPRDEPMSFLAVFGGGAQLPTFTVVERNGRWFLSPVASLLSSTLDTLRATSPSQVDALGQRVGPSVRALTDRIDGLGPTAGEDRATNDPARLADVCHRLAAQAAARPGTPPDRALTVDQACTAHLRATGRLPADPSTPSPG